MTRTSECSALCLHEVPANCDLIAAFERLRAWPYPWLLDSGAAPGFPGPRQSRYSFAGADPYCVLRAYGTRNALEWRGPEPPSSRAGGAVPAETVVGDPLEVMRSLMPPAPSLPSPDALRAVGWDGPAPPFLGGAVGYLGYELAQRFEPLSLDARDDLGMPDLYLLFVDRVLVFDQLERRALVACLGLGDTPEEAREAGHAGARGLLALLARSGRPSAPDRPAARDALTLRKRLLSCALPADTAECLGEDDYIAAVETILEEIGRGNVYQANLTQRLDIPLDAASETGHRDLGWALYAELRRSSPAPFAAYLELPEAAIASSSPERFLSLDREGGVESRPIKGTRPRGRSEEEDAVLEAELADASKDRAENLMIVDLVRNDLGRVCEPGSIEVPELMSVERYATVFQLVSSVRGRLRPGCDGADLIRASFPPGSMTGAPKIAAMRIIDALEPVRRGVYSGAIGYLDAWGGLDLSVVIRTLLVRPGRIHLHSGGAVVSDSQPLGEYHESLVKIRALMAAVEAVRGGQRSEARGAADSTDPEREPI